MVGVAAVVVVIWCCNQCESVYYDDTIIDMEQYV